MDVCRGEIRRTAIGQHQVNGMTGDGCKVCTSFHLDLCETGRTRLWPCWNGADRSERRPIGGGLDDRLIVVQHGPEVALNLREDGLDVLAVVGSISVEHLARNALQRLRVERNQLLGVGTRRDEFVVAVGRAADAISRRHGRRALVAEEAIADADAVNGPGGQLVGAGCASRRVRRLERGDLAADDDFGGLAGKDEIFARRALHRRVFQLLERRTVGQMVRLATATLAGAVEERRWSRPGVTETHRHDRNARLEL